MVKKSKGDNKSQGNLTGSQFKINEGILLNNVNFESDSFLLYWHREIVKQCSDWGKG